MYEKKFFLIHYLFHFTIFLTPSIPADINYPPGNIFETPDAIPSTGLKIGLKKLPTFPKNLLNFYPTVNFGFLVEI